MSAGRTPAALVIRWTPGEPIAVFVDAKTAEAEASLLRRLESQAEQIEIHWALHEAILDLRTRLGVIDLARERRRRRAA